MKQPEACYVLSPIVDSDPQKKQKEKKKEMSREEW